MPNHRPELTQRSASEIGHLARMMAEIARRKAAPVTLLGYGYGWILAGRETGKTRESTSCVT